MTANRLLAGVTQLFRNSTARARGILAAILCRLVGVAALSRAIAYVEARDDTWMTIHARPRRTANARRAPDTISDLVPRIGIVLQGPITVADDFTLETVRLYRRHFPTADIIVSTWADEDAGQVAQLRDAGTTVLLNEKPSMSGHCNTNYQLASAVAGIRECAARGLPIALKSRTDQRMYAPNALSFLHAALTTFPPHPGFNQKGRIIGVSTNTLKYRMYGLSDFLTFGYTDDLLEYWSCDPDTRTIQHNRPFTIGEHARDNLCETYFATAYLRRIGREIRWTLADSWDAFAAHFCIIDHNSLDLFWPKYHRWSEYRRLSYDRTRSDTEMTFADWLLLYARVVDSAAAPEAALECLFGEDILGKDGGLNR
ncbi:MAG TPA: WavE lipopolysaccharide synthesis family protein [Humisphaera sp.]